MPMPVGGMPAFTAVPDELLFAAPPVVAPRSREQIARSRRR